MINTKGTIVSAWVKTCKSLYGDELTNKSLEHFCLDPDKIFTPTEDIEDKKAIGIVDYIGKNLGKSSFDIWREMGNSNVMTFSKDYPAFFRYKSLYAFLNAMYDIHMIVTKKIPGSKPPILNVEPIEKNKVAMSYKSPREMFGYFQGMLEGASKFYNEEIHIETVEKKDGYIKVNITFPKEVYFHKSYWWNKFLSFGFIKKLDVKIGLASLILIGIPYILMENFLSGKILLPATLALSFAVPYLVSRNLFSPEKSIFKTLKEIQNRDFSTETHISTGDFFEDINENLNSVKAIIKSDFIGYKGTTDELNVFADKFNEISTNMQYTSKEISNVVEQVAQGAVSQAEETENSAYLLNDSINSLNLVVNKESKGKEDLEKAVDMLNEGYGNLQNTSKSLNNILEQFSIVKENGLNLQNRAKDVNKIVETVSAISDKTNLLALNASIEASRAGEYGQGFTVVAMEIRKLAESSKIAVKNINQNLESLIEEIDSFVSQIGEQFSILQEENISLSKVAKDNYETVLSIKNVSSLLIELVNDLSKETGDMNKISSNIESLAAIAEENSASSEEVSANVTSYTEEIKKMIGNINEFKKASEEFNQELEKYIM